MPPLPPFANEPVLELRRATVRAQLAEALERLDRELPLSVPVMIGDQDRPGPGFDSADPGDPERIVAHAARALSS